LTGPTAKILIPSGLKKDAAAIAAAQNDSRQDYVSDELFEQ
jgi:hypothetical protein